MPSVITYGIVVRNNYLKEDHEYTHEIHHTNGYLTYAQ